MVHSTAGLQDAGSNDVSRRLQASFLPNQACSTFCSMVLLCICCRHEFVAEGGRVKIFMAHLENLS